MALREIEFTLPPGFKFFPSDEELVCHYLHKKVANERIAQGTLVEVDLHAREPWELPDVAKLTASEWYFFSFRDRKYATGSRTNRATKTGYWKATGKDREVRSPATRAVVGMRKTLVFYHGRAPNGVKSGWVMHEFRLDTPRSSPREYWVLCRVFEKTKGDGAADGHDSASGASSSPTLTGSSSHVDAPVLQEHHAPCGGYYGAGFAPQQEVAVLLPCYGSYGPPAVDRHGFPQDDAGGALPAGFEFGAREVAGDEYGFGYFDMAGFEYVGNHGHGGMGFPQGWD